MKGKISLMKRKRTHLIEGLSHLLADTYLLYLKTQNFHWNVTGSNFYALHKMFEDQYGQLANAVDLIAERIRALKAPAPATLAEYQKLTSLHEAGHHLNSESMLRELMNDHETIAKLINGLFLTAEEERDEVTLDLLIQRKNEHDKTAWMLHSSLGRG